MIMVSKKKSSYTQNTDTLKNTAQNNIVSEQDSSQAVEYVWDIYSQENSQHDTSDKITLSMILKNLYHTAYNHKSDLVKYTILLGCVLFSSYFIKSFLSDTLNNALIPNIIIKMVHFFASVIVGVAILRMISLTPKAQKECSFFHGFTPFIGLHFVLNMLLVTSVFALELFYNAFDISINVSNSQYYKIVTIATMSLITSLFLTRFSSVFVSILHSYHKSTALYTTSMSQITHYLEQPFLNNLFLPLFCTKFICLITLFFFNAPLSINTSDTIPLFNMALNSFVFVAYCIFIYMLMGVSFQLSCRNK
jgi:hypothetical protein